MAQTLDTCPLPRGEAGRDGPSAITRAAVARLYPTRTQAALLRRWQGGLRFVWNSTWAWCQAQREIGGSWPNGAAIQNHMVGLKSLPDTKWLSELPAHAVLALAEDLNRAMRNWFEKRTGRPRFRAKHQRQFSIYAVNQRTEFGAGKVKLPKLGGVRYRAGNLPNGRLLFSRIYREGEKWLIASVFECARIEPPEATVARVGVDMGLKALATTFDGERVHTVENPRALREHEARLRRYQRRVSRRKKGSAGCKRAKEAVSRLHQRIASIRRDAAHKATSELVARAHTLVVETLTIRGMVKNRTLAKHVHDAGMGEFLRMLRYKAAWSERTVIEADQWFPSSKLCSKCGALHDMPLSARWYSCGCGNTMDRDENAARNLFAYREEPGNVGETPVTRGESGGQAAEATRSSVPDAEPRMSKQPNPSLGMAKLDNSGRGGLKINHPLRVKRLVPRAGLEPALLSEPDFESGVSTNFTTEAGRER
jgi:putative transposase